MTSLQDASSAATIQQGPHECDQCGNRFKRRTFLRKHIREGRCKRGTSCSPETLKTRGRRLDLHQTQKNIHDLKEHGTTGTTVPSQQPRRGSSVPPRTTTPDEEQEQEQELTPTNPSFWDFLTQDLPPIPPLPVTNDHTSNIPSFDNPWYPQIIQPANADTFNVSAFGNYRNSQDAQFVNTNALSTPLFNDSWVGPQVLQPTNTDTSNLSSFGNLQNLQDAQHVNTDAFNMPLFDNPSYRYGAQPQGTSTPYMHHSEQTSGTAPASLGLDQAQLSTPSTAGGVINLVPGQTGRTTPVADTSSQLSITLPNNILRAQFIINISRAPTPTTPTSQDVLPASTSEPSKFITNDETEFLAADIPSTAQKRSRDDSSSDGSPNFVKKARLNQRQL